MHEIVWVGIRQSDIEYTNNLFAGSITVFGKETSSSASMETESKKRPNYNDSSFDEPFYSYITTKMNEFIVDNPNCLFMHYSPIDAYYISKDFINHTIGSNSKYLLDFFENKFLSKAWALEFTLCLPSISIKGKDFSWSFCAKNLSVTDAFILQGVNSCGGNNTYYVDQENESSIALLLADDEEYAVTVYQPRCISVNVHAVIFDSGPILFAPSVQIIRKGYTMEYAGCDFSGYQRLDVDDREKVANTASLICDHIHALGYRGVCGIDLMLINGKVYFAEINPRFQASTFLLNVFLSNNGYPSVQEYHYQAHIHTSCPYPIPPQLASGSCYNYTYPDLNLPENMNELFYIKSIHSIASSAKMNGVRVVDDFLSWSTTFEKHTYLFKLLFDRNITYIDKCGLTRLHNSLFPMMLSINNSLSKENLIKLKIMLMSRGIRIEDNALEIINDKGGMDYEEFEALNICICNEVWISVPMENPFYQLSPFSIIVKSNSLWLAVLDKPLFHIKVMPADPCAERKLSTGRKVKEVAYLGSDRLRVFHRDGCAYREQGVACHFCDLVGFGKQISLSEQYEAINHYRNHKNIKHYLIGGGSNAPTENYDRIAALATYLKCNYNKSIYLMTTPISDNNILQRLKEAGISEVAFNIEMFDREYARKIMPGKGTIEVSEYEAAFKHSVSLFGTDGSVRSMVLLGIDEKGDLFKGIEWLCQLGVTPMLAILRAVNNTPLEHYIAPTEREIYEIYEYVEYTICSGYNIHLGPVCSSCQNNTLQITIQHEG